MSRYTMTEDAAFAAISRASQNQNIKVRDLAVAITSIGELPGQ
jgi:AmiR/NasT family two-component response regulator